MSELHLTFYVLDYILETFRKYFRNTSVIFSNEYLCCSNCLCKLHKIYLLRALNCVFLGICHQAEEYFSGKNFSENHSVKNTMLWVTVGHGSHRNSGQHFSNLSLNIKPLTRNIRKGCIFFSSDFPLILVTMIVW